MSFVARDSSDCLESKSSDAPQVPGEYQQLNLEIEFLQISEIISFKDNTRTHSKKQIGQIAESIDNFKFVAPVLVSADRTLIAGHGRVAAARQLGYTSIPAIVVTHLTDAQQRALRIADNRIAELAGWNKKFLAKEFAFLTSDLNIDFNVTVTGFDEPEIDELIVGFGDDEASADERDVIPEVSSERPVSQLGDRFDLDEHRIICGDSTDSGTFSELLGNERANMASSDGPYNVRSMGM